jgi:hypothetical protein
MVFSQPPFDRAYRELIVMGSQLDRHLAVGHPLKSAGQEQNNNDQQHHTGDARGGETKRVMTPVGQTSHQEQNYDDQQ